MQITVQGEQLFLKWKHHNNTGKVDKIKDKVYPVQSFTECWVEDIDRNVLGEKESAHMHYTDKNYSKEVGRKVSLTRLMQNNPIFANKADRSVVWNQYFNRCKDPGTKVANAVEQSERSTSTV